MKKKSIIALILACSFAFGTATLTACNVTETDNNQNLTDGSDKNETEKPSVTPPVTDPPVTDTDDDDDNTVTAPPASDTDDDDNNGSQTPPVTGGDDDGDGDKTDTKPPVTGGDDGDDDDDKGGTVVSEKFTYSYAGNECAAFEWADANPSGATVEYKLSSASSYTALTGADKQNLVRASKSAGTARVDIVGLKGGEKYDFKITPSSGGAALTATDITIHAYDRSGYAHFDSGAANKLYGGADGGVGAYKHDGTPKDNAKIIYLTEENKNNVDGSGKSIAQYLKNAANNTAPIIIRVVGTVGSATWNEKDYGDQYGKASMGKTPLSAALVSQLTPGTNNKKLATEGEVTYYQDADCYNYQDGAETLVGVYNTLNLHPSRADGLYSERECTAIKGLNSYMKVKSGVYDSCWNDCSVPNMNNVTVEGIGEDAEIFQWGFTFKTCNSIEVRNLHFDDYTEDACSFEGDKSSSAADNLADISYGHIWLHHNTFDEGMNYWDVCDEQDKGDGDGSTDFKGVKNVTLAYNHYIKTHKTNLIGGSDNVASANITFHHNHYEGCDQRMPLGRQANMHMYNNYYDASTMYSISLRAGAYAFIENCVFTQASNAKYPLELVSGSYGIPTAKIIGCSINDSKISDNVSTKSDKYLYVGADRSYKMNNANVDDSNGDSKNKIIKQRFAPDFDTNSTLFYYDGTKSDVTIMFTAEETKTYVPLLAGVQKRSGDVTSGGTGNGNTGGSTTGGGNQGGTTGGTTTTATPIVLTCADFGSGTSATKGGITFTITSDISTDTNNKSTAFNYGGNSYSSVGNLYFSGGGKLTSDTPSKYLEFTADKAFKITVVAKGADNRKMHLVKDKTEVAVFEAGATQELTTQTVNAGGTYRLASTGNGTRVFYIIIEYV